jgi:hypothetical protein
VASQLIVGFVIVTFDRRLLEGAVHAFDLAVGPRKLRLGQAMINIVLGAGQLKGMRAEDLASLQRQLDVRRG